MDLKTNLRPDLDVWLAAISEEAETRRRESKRERARQERRDHPEKDAARKRRYQLKHPEKLRAYQRSRYADMPAEARLARSLKQNHKMTLNEFEAMWSAQNGRCYLCGDKLERNNRNIHIEHDHRCCPRGKSCASCRRGLSCPHCNFVIGHAFDDPERLRRIADNLETAITNRQTQ
jgi:hypothetical protein